MITKLYDRYFQKSRTFLYPILGISKKDYAPLQTYISLEREINPEDRKLVCMFEHKNLDSFTKFEEKSLLRNPLYEESLICENELSIYVFNFNMFPSDWDFFLEGKYSKLSPEFKQAIKNYYGSSSGSYEYIDTYLYPEKYYGLYSKLLDEPIELIRANRELCDKYNPEKEELKFSPNYLEKLKEI